MAVIFIQRWECLGRWQTRQRCANFVERLQVTLERAGIDRIETLTTCMPVAAKLLRLLGANGAELVIVVGPERCLTVAYKVDGSHARIFGRLHAVTCLLRDPIHMALKKILLIEIVIIIDFVALLHVLLKLNLVCRLKVQGLAALLWL